MSDSAGEPSGTGEPAPPDVPEAFDVVAPTWLRVVWLVSTIVIAVGVALSPSFLGVVSAVVIAFATTVQFTWRGRVSPNGMVFDNRLGQGWSRAWSELQPGAEIARPGRTSSLVRGRLTSGRPVRFPNGVVTTASGQELAPETVQGLIKAWAEAGAA